MKNSHVSIIEERQFITKEFADTLAGKLPAPYLRLHDPVQYGLARLAADLRGRSLGETAYLDRMIHFWREVSLAALPCAGKAIDECYALLFESTFSLARLEPAWGIACLNKAAGEVHIDALQHFANQVRTATIAHSDLINALTHLYAPQREQTATWQNPVNVALAGELWFWAAIHLAVGLQENDWLWAFHYAIAQLAATDWNDGDRLHIRLIREAPIHAPVTPRAELMAHPLIRLARLKHREGSTEQMQVVRFLNSQCIRSRIESEEQFLGSDLTLAQWTRDARAWTAERRQSEPRVYDALVEEAGQETVERTRRFYFEQLGESPEQVDALDATALLMRWARAKRGCQCTGYRGELWEFIVEIVDAALWLGWLFPQKSKARSSTERLRPGASRFTSYGRVTLKNLINFSERRRNNCHSLGRISGQAVHL